jgi:hypothetical protein
VSRAIRAINKMKFEITSNDIDYALNPSPWDLANQVLYSLCQSYPNHEADQAIIAKLLLIGRTYAAAIERRKNAEETSDDFYEVTVVEKIKKSNIDNWLSSLPNQILDPWQELGDVITVHKRVMDIFYELTGLEKRALASKYLHFHKPNLFFIYDSRAKEAISKITPRPSYIKDIPANESDSEYHIFCRRCLYLQDRINERFDKRLTPRQIDKILLRITDKIRKERLE